MGKQVVDLDCMPACEHWWRINGEMPVEAPQYLRDMAATFQSDPIGFLAKKGDQLITSMYGLYQSLCALHEDGCRQMEPRLKFARTYQDLVPEQSPWIVSTLTVGVGAVYNGGTPLFPRDRSFPYQMTDEQHCVLARGGIMERCQGWAHGRMYHAIRGHAGTS